MLISITTPQLTTFQHTLHFSILLLKLESLPEYRGLPIPIAFPIPKTLHKISHPSICIFQTHAFYCWKSFLNNSLITIKTFPHLTYFHQSDCPQTLAHLGLMGTLSFPSLEESWYQGQKSLNIFFCLYKISSLDLTSHHVYNLEFQCTRPPCRS